MRNEVKVTCSLTVCTAGCCLCVGQRRCGTSVQGTGHSHDSQQLHHLLPSFHPAHPPPAESQQVTIFTYNIHPTSFKMCLQFASPWFNNFKLNTLQLKEGLNNPCNPLNYGDKFVYNLYTHMECQISKMLHAPSYI